MKPILVWFRRDLRLSDNPALCQALCEGHPVLPVFVLDPALRQTPEGSPRRTAFLLRCLHSLQGNLEQAGSPLILRLGNPEDELPRLAQDCGAEAIYWNDDYNPDARHRDQRLSQACGKMGLRVKTFPDPCILAPGSVLKPDGTPYAVFTPYAKAWLATKAPAPLPRPKKIPAPGKIPTASLPAKGESGPPSDILLPAAGEKAALEQLKLYMQKHVRQYDENRDYPALDATSRLSIHLTYGTLSPRSVLAAALKTRLDHAPDRAALDVFIKELIWRDFYKTILFFHPRSATTCFKKEYDALAWENNPALFRAWCEGRTGYPLVDAAMRQLNQTGWMHNRLRMLVASFLTKDLRVCWQWGERYFMKQLLDGDLAANVGGWQWAAGTGTDAQPYFRIFNPSSQTEKFDPEGRFIARFVPELDSPEYPPPIVSHSEQRSKTLAMFQKIRNESFPA